MLEVSETGEDFASINITHLSPLASEQMLVPTWRLRAVWVTGSCGPEVWACDIVYTKARVTLSLLHRPGVTKAPVLSPLPNLPNLLL